MRPTFGEDLAHEHVSAKNGLVLAKKIKQIFDKHPKVMIPNLGADIKAFQLIFDRSLHSDIIHISDTLTFRQLHNSELMSKGKARPARRYSY